MKISTSLEHGKKIEGVSARESARMMKLAGFDGVDLNMCHDMMDNAKILTAEWSRKVFDDAEALKAEGLEISQCHLPYYPGHLPLPGDGSIEAFVDLVSESWAHAIEIAGQVGCPVAVMHPFFDMNAEAEKTYEGNVRLIEKLMPAMKKWNVKLALENCYGHNGDYVDGHAARPEDIMEILRRTDEDLTPTLDRDLQLALGGNGRLRLDYAGTNTIRRLRLGGQSVCGVIDASHESGRVFGPGALYVPPYGTMMIFR